MKASTILKPRISVRVLNRNIPLIIRSNKLVSQLLYPYYSTLTKDDEYFDKWLDESISKYIEKRPELASSSIRKDMILEYIKTGMFPYEYTLYDFYNKKESERKNYITRSYTWHYFINNKKVNHLPQGKYNKYMKFASFYKRDITHINFDGSDTDISKYKAFASKHATIIAKPTYGLEGKGIMKISISPENYLYWQETFKKDVLFEEIIEQGAELAMFHPESINSVRIATTMSPAGDFSILFTLFRTGTNGSNVDNVGSGGIISRINSQDGTIISDGLKNGEFIERHPNSGIPFKGYKMPDWDKLCDIAKNAHMRQKDQGIIGWDFAWSKKGWVIIELNACPSFQSIQFFKGNGIKPDLQERGVRFS